MRRVLTLPFLNGLLRALASRLLSTDTARRLPIRKEEVEGSAGSTRFVLLSPVRCTNAKELFWGQGQLPDPAEQRTLEVFTELATTSDVVLDVGAYTGMFTVAALRANPEAHAHAFEMMPETFGLLVANCARNAVLDRVTCHHVAVGDPARQVSVPLRTGRASLPTGYSSDRPAPSGVPVRSVAIDGLADQVPAGASVAMKVDVEGTEAEVFQHALRLVELFHPTIVCEILPGGDPSGWVRLLLDQGYEAALITDRSVEPKSRVHGHEHHRNWVFSTQPVCEVLSRDVLGTTRPPGATA